MDIIHQKRADHIRKTMTNRPHWIATLCICYAISTTLPATNAFADNIEWKMIKEVSLDQPPIDVVTSYDGAYAFILTAKEIVVYSRKEDKIVNRISVDKTYDRISFSKVSNEFMLTSKGSKSLSFYRVTPIYNINIDNQPYVGAADAPVTIIIYDNYQCSACKRFSGFINDVLKLYAGQVKVVIKFYPNPEDELAGKAAAAAMAAQMQGKFWDFHKALFDNQVDLDDDKILLIAKELALDIDIFKTDMTSQDVAALIDRNLDEGKKLRIDVTPTVIINGRHLERNDYAILIGTIETELKKRRSG
jgi:protein-disulfide isomerase